MKTKLVCPVCGTEMELPEHESICLGKTLANDSNAGTVYLTPKKENKNMTRAEERMQQLKAAGVDVSKFMVLTDANGEGFIFKQSENGLVPLADSDPILDKIKSSGYVFNRFVDPRWITGQMFQMLAFRSYFGNGNGYDAALTAKGYEYQFRFVQDELHRLAKMEREKDPHLKERGQFFTCDVVYDMVCDYYNCLVKYVKHLPVNKCKGVDYKRIPGFKHGNDNKGDVFLDDVERKVINPVYSSRRKFAYGGITFNQLSREFDRWMRDIYIPLGYKFRQSKSFRDAYKGLGAYYTCDNLIKFHGCCVYDEFGRFNQEGSLDILHKKAEEYKGKYWRLFAFMKKLIDDNNFVPDWR